MNLAWAAMEYARKAHEGQKRKYSGNPYFDHLAEVVGITASVNLYSDRALAVAWLHDTVEDTGTTEKFLRGAFGQFVAEGVMLLSDIETGNRAERKAASRARLAAAPEWIQNIKCADLISNTSSIVQHDPEFAKVYLEEKRLLLEVLDKANPQIRAMAMRMCQQ